MSLTSPGPGVGFPRLLLQANASELQRPQIHLGEQPLTTKLAIENLPKIPAPKSRNLYIIQIDGGSYLDTRELTILRKYAFSSDALP